MREAARWNWENAIVLGGLGLAIAGCLAPWVDHSAAGLAMTGLELGEFAKSFPHVIRAFLYVPFAAALVVLAMVSGEIIRTRARLLAPPLCAAVLLAAAFPYAFVTSAYDALTAGSQFVADSRYTAQAAVAVAGGLLALLAPLAWRLGPRARGGILAPLAAAGAGLGLWQYAVLYPSVTAVYGRPAQVGWGVFACGLGLAAAAAAGIRRAVQPGGSNEGQG
jgi:hypothetical protein